MLDGVITEVFSWTGMMPVNAKNGVASLKWRFQIPGPGVGDVALTAALIVYEPGPPLAIAIFLDSFVVNIAALAGTFFGEVVLPCDLSLFTGNLGNAQMFYDVSRDGTSLADTYAGDIQLNNGFVEVGV